jgi:hypothetical protein
MKLIVRRANLYQRTGTSIFHCMEKLDYSSRKYQPQIAKFEILAIFPGIELAKWLMLLLSLTRIVERKGR